jgi:hypothetical protein
VIFPDDFFDEESTDSYPFRIQSVTGGVPVPPPIGLKGSFPRRAVLRCSIRRGPHLVGSIGARIGGQIGKTRRRR